MTHGFSSTRVVLVTALIVGCSEGGNDNGIYGSSVVTFGDDADDEADESASSDGGDTTTTDDGTNDDADGSTSSSTDTSDDDPTSTTNGTTTESTSDGGGDCGNGVIDPGEQCDGGNLAGNSCIDLGYTGGTLACDPGICVFDTSQCTNDGGTTGNNNDCGTYCDQCTCPSDACIMCCAQAGKVDACFGGMCSCF